MFKVFAYLTRRPGTTREEFIDYYENHHVPLVRSLASMPRVYKRNYVVSGDSADPGSSATDFNVVTEMIWDDRTVTTDGGKKWRVSLRPKGNNFNELVSISCPSAATCAAAGTAHIGGPARFIVATSDGGSTWPAQTHPAGKSELLSNSCSRTGRSVAVGNWWNDQFTNSGALILLNHHL